jgi:hypothetical protein
MKLAIQYTPAMLIDGVCFEDDVEKVLKDIFLH